MVDVVDVADDELDVVDVADDELDVVDIRVLVDGKVVEE